MLELLLLHLQIHIVSLQLLLLRLQAPRHLVLFGPVRFQLVDTLLHTVKLRIQLLELLILGFYFFFGLLRSLFRRLHCIVRYLRKQE